MTLICGICVASSFMTLILVTKINNAYQGYAPRSRLIIIIITEGF